MVTFKIVRLHCNVDLIYFSKRADSGNAHSRENPSFVAGAAGGCGSVWLEPDDCVALRLDDFVSRPIASTVSAGGCHGRRFAMPVLSDFVGCIVCPRNNHACKRSMGSASAWQDRHEIMCPPKRPLCSNAADLATCADRLAPYRQNRARCIDTAAKRRRFLSRLRNKSFLGSVQ
jgi:hypothetical protein